MDREGTSVGLCLIEILRLMSYVHQGVVSKENVLVLVQTCRRPLGLRGVFWAVGSRSVIDG